MKEFSSAGNPVDPRDFDRLVDGELNEAERRRLLSSLDACSDGWRQCAMAFLESQSWEDEFGALLSDPDQRGSAQAAASIVAVSVAPASIADSASVTPATSVVEGATPQPAKRVPLGSAHWGRLLAMAASFLVTFSLGGILQRTWNAHQPPASNPERPNVAAVGVQSAAAGQQLAGTAPQQAPWQTVRVAVGGGGNGTQRTVEVPVVDGNSLGPLWLREQTPLVPENVRAALEHTGHVVHQDRAYWPVELPDGRRAVVPVDQVEIRPVSDRSMQ